MSAILSFFKMGGYAGYLWSAYLIVFVVLLLNARHTYRHYKRAHDSEA